jgi:sigma-E factor negative regulatory protein RseC
MIEHKGRVVSVTEQEMVVEVVSPSTCAGCKAKSFCSLNGEGEKLIALPLKAGETWSVGEEVMVVLHTSLGLKAVLLTYIIPLIFMLIPLFTLPYFGVSELLTGIAAITSPLLYYFFVWLFRYRIEKEVIFAAKKLNFI